MNYPLLQTEVLSLLGGSGAPKARLQALCELMREKVPKFDWFGFYIARRAERLLDLGPYAGEPTEHILIPFGRGICGQAAENRDTYIVDDVSAASNYLACSLKVKSEIVVPVLDPTTGDVAGEVDIDSHSVAAFGAEDRAFLELLAGLVAADIALLRI